MEKLLGARAFLPQFGGGCVVPAGVMGSLRFFLPTPASGRTCCEHVLGIEPPDRWSRSDLRAGRTVPSGGRWRPRRVSICPGEWPDCQTAPSTVIHARRAGGRERPGPDDLIGRHAAGRGGWAARAYQVRRHPDERPSYACRSHRNRRRSQAPAPAAEVPPGVPGKKVRRPAGSH